MSWGSADGRLELSALYNLASQIQRQGFQTADLLSAFVESGGSQIGRDDRSSPDFDLTEGLLSGRLKGLTKTDRPGWNHKAANKHTDRFYNSPSPQLVGNCGNWVFAKPAKDWCLATSECSLYDLRKLMEMSLLNVCRGAFLPYGGPVYQWFYFGLGKSDTKSLCAPASPQ